MVFKRKNDINQVEKDIGVHTGEEELKSIVSRHTTEYDLYVAKSTPSAIIQTDGHKLRQSLDPRHVSMIAIGGALGTGLLIGTGSALKTAGPGAILLSYSLIGFVVYIVMCSLGEIASHIPLNGFANYGKRYTDEALGFACGYIYLVKYLILPANQLTAGALTMQYWVDRDSINPGVWITIFLVIMVIINFLGVRVFGEIEFWLSSLKIVTCLGLIILLWVIALGGGPTHDRIGFRYWKDPGAFLHYEALSKNLIIEGPKGRFVAFVSVLVMSVFSYLGAELCSLTFAECRNPRRAIPKAVKLTLYRILIFYIMSILFVGMCVSARDPLLMSASGTNAGASPFVIAIKNARIGGLDSVINACILLFVLSAANSDMYVCSRSLYSLAADGYAPKLFTKTNKMGVPYFGVCVSALFCLLAYMNVSSGSAQIFQHFVNLVSQSGLIAWSSILVFHIGFMRALKAQGFDRKRDLVYRSPLQPFATYFCLAVCILVMFIKNFTVFLGNEFDYASFITGYILLPIFLILFFGYKFWYKTKWLKPEEVDLHTFKDVIDAEFAKYEAEDSERRAIRDATGKKIDSILATSATSANSANSATSAISILEYYIYRIDNGRYISQKCQYHRNPKGRGTSNFHKHCHKGKEDGYYKFKDITAGEWHCSIGSSVLIVNEIEID
ncbi:DIP5 [Candida oxycetoniae]|uniref:DIP5 n=1 Tax=Candida oxycetoniae TaxID=497107 RepID=A0AAI9SVQ4_9ASCO|nr:DIP5 [Candida oxycetoniae]KAI3403842.2 DIP5 [Candida oxycetoniae]